MSAETPQGELQFESLRVLCVTNQYPTEEHPGEAPCIEDQVRALRNLGLHVDVEIIDRFNSPRSYLGAAARFFRKNFSSFPYDIVHAYYGYSALAGLCQRRCPVVLTYRGSDLLGGIDGRIGRRVASHVHGAITMTQEMKVQTGREDTKVIPFGIDLDQVKPEDTLQARRALGLSETAPLVLFPYDPARAVKRFDLVEATVDRLRSDFPEIETVVVHSKPQQELVRFMSACDALLMTSEYEGSPLAVREALSVDLPIVSLPVGDVPELIQDVEGCALVEIPEPDRLADAIRPILASRARCRGREKMQQFDLRWSALEVARLYEEVLKQRVGRKG